MKTIKFKTNINCGGCVSTVTPFLNKAIGEDKWQVETTNPQKILTVSADDLNESTVIKAVNEAGFKAETL